MKYILDKVCPDGDAQVAYVHLLDDESGEIIGMVCVPYTGNGERFRQAVQEKFKALLQQYKEQKNIKNEIQEILNDVIPLAKQEVKQK